MIWSMIFLADTCKLLIVLFSIISSSDNEQQQEIVGLHCPSHRALLRSQHAKVHGGDPDQEQRHQRGGPEPDSPRPQLHLLVHAVSDLAPHPHHRGPPLHWSGLHEPPDLHWNQTKQTGKKEQMENSILMSFTLEASKCVQKGSIFTTF